MNCPNCNTTIDGKYCSNCGKSPELARIDGKYIRGEIGSVLNLDKGILLTVRELLLRPNQSIRAFLFEDRSRLVKPIIFIIICSLIYSIAQGVLHFEDGYVEYSTAAQDAIVIVIFKWIQANYGYANIIMAFFIAFWTKLLFRKWKYSYFEILVLIFFVMGIGMLIYSVFGIIERLSSLRVFHVGGVIGTLYASWAIGQFFDQRKLMSYVKGLLSYLFGTISFFFLAMLIGFILESLMR
ncbi:DUF3667 domain-containing protein [Catalinimonas sp. 4WD22]|uniref:DUF3667 domain-containing protein n=1 Tax=Catalinimonas locisalis TaxID=3133978 RepID=UPI0031014DE2